MFKALLNLIFPTLCVNCRKDTLGTICDECSGSITPNQTLFCGKCGLRLASGKKVCHKDFPYILGAASNYDTNAVKELIHGLKFRLIKGAAKPLGEMLVKYVNGLPVKLTGYIVLPIPLSAARLRERGFNQSELIARVFSENLGLPMEKNLLIRTKNTKPQSETKSIAERRENISRCFAAKFPGLVDGKNIILIDDVTTSGTTLYEAARVLKSAGAKKIFALTVARA